MNKILFVRTVEYDRVNLLPYKSVANLGWNEFAIIVISCLCWINELIPCFYYCIISLRYFLYVMNQKAIPKRFVTSKVYCNVALIGISFFKWSLLLPLSSYHCVCCIFRQGEGTYTVSTDTKESAGSSNCRRWENIWEDCSWPEERCHHHDVCPLLWCVQGIYACLQQACKEV